MEKIIQANIYSLLLLLIYFLFLRTSTSYSWSRFYLLFSAAFSLLLPFIPFDFSDIITNNPNTVLSVELPVATITSKMYLDQNMATLQWLQYVYWLYVGVGIIFYGSQYLILNGKLKSSPYNIVEGYKMYLNTGIGPGSFGKNIIIPKAEIDPQILRHEIAHIKHLHFYDKAFLRIGTILCPLVFPLYFIQKELSFIHELQADQKACENKEQYAMLLLNTQFQTQSLPFIQLFFHHPLKKRIMMLQTSKPIGKFQKVALMASFLLLGSGLVLMQGCKQEKAPVAVTKTAIADSTNVKEMPSFPGGEEALYDYLAKEIEYPKGDTNQGTVRVSFLVDKDGFVKDAKVKRPVSPRLDSTALAVVSKMPKWTPAKDANGNSMDMHFMVPIRFELQN